MAAERPPTEAIASNRLSQQVQKALSLRLEAPEARRALCCLSEFYRDNTKQSRLDLRTTIEARNLLLHEDFISSFAALEAKIESLDQLVQGLDEACGRVAEQLQTSRSETQGLLQNAAVLREEAQALEQKREVLDHFLRRFRLPESDAQLLRDGERPLDEDFLSALGRLESIRSSARQMLSTCGRQTAGADVLHETSAILEATYERMFVWVQQRCRGLAAGSSSKSFAADGDLLGRVVRILRERPVYFNHAMRDISRAREQALVRRFHEALRRGSAGFAAPLELHAHDPARYVGDMLAWIHEEALSERDCLASLMGPGPADKSVEAPVAGEGPPLILVEFHELLDLTLQGLVAPCSSRSLRALEERGSVVQTYKVCQIFAFFAKALDEGLQGPTALVSMCKDLQARSFQAFLELWEAQTTQLHQGVAGIYVSALRAPSFVTDTVSTLAEILAIYDMSLVPSEEREADFLPILSAALDPQLNHCKHVAALMDAADGLVFLINCVSSMLVPLRRHAFTAQRAALYSTLLDEFVSSLIEALTDSVLQKLGLADICKATGDEKHPSNSLSSSAPAAATTAASPLSGGPSGPPQLPEQPQLHPGLSAVSIAATLRSFYNAVFTSGGALSLPLLDRVVAPDPRADVRNGVLRRVAEAYGGLHELVQELGVASYTPEQIRAALLAA